MTENRENGENGIETTNKEIDGPCYANKNSERVEEFLKLHRPKEVTLLPDAVIKAAEKAGYAVIRGKPLETKPDSALSFLNLNQLRRLGQSARISEGSVKPGCIRVVNPSDIRQNFEFHQETPEINVRWYGKIEREGVIFSPDMSDQCHVSGYDARKLMEDTLRILGIIPVSVASPEPIVGFALAPKWAGILSDDGWAKIVGINCFQTEARAQAEEFIQTLKGYLDRLEEKRKRKVWNS